MGVTTDPNDPDLRKINPSGMQESYLVLSEEERAKGFVRPVRRSYKHVGARPKVPTRELTADEHERYDRFGYVAYEPYPDSEDHGAVTGRYWTKEQLESGCGSVTTMGVDIAESYARSPAFYGATYCATCGKHFSVGEHGEFVWEPDGSRVGT